MSAAPDDAVTPPGLPKTPVSFRLGDLEPEVARRKRVHEGAVATIRRDLTRYYAGVRVALQRLEFDRNDAYLLCLALRHAGAGLDAGTARFLWAVVDEQVRNPKNTFFREEHTRERALGLVEQLRGLSPFDALAILDGVEIYWDHYTHNGGDLIEAMEASQLSTESPDDEPQTEERS